MSTASTAGWVIAVCLQVLLGLRQRRRRRPGRRRCSSLSGRPRSGVITAVGLGEGLRRRPARRRAGARSMFDVLRALARCRGRPPCGARAAAAEDALRAQRLPDRRRRPSSSALRALAALLGQLGGVAVVDGEALRRARGRPRRRGAARARGPLPRRASGAVERARRARPPTRAPSDQRAAQRAPWPRRAAPVAAVARRRARATVRRRLPSASSARARAPRARRGSWCRRSRRR